MLAPKFLFDSEEGADQREGAAAEPPVTAWRMLKWSLIVGAVALVLFVCFPKIDLAITELFYRGRRHFVGRDIIAVPVIRMTLNIFFYLTCALVGLGLVMAARNAGKWLDLSLNKWLFVAICLITGPLVLTNLGLKDHWGRARPRDVVEFSGTKAFTPPFPASKQCDYNCSFVSGEASSIFIVFFAAALLFPLHSRTFVALGVVLGGLSGLMRMLQGAHFLSDVVFAGVLMAATAATIYILFERLEGKRLTRAEQSVA